MLAGKYRVLAKQIPSGHKSMERILLFLQEILPVVLQVNGLIAFKPGVAKSNVFGGSSVE